MPTPASAKWPKPKSDDEFEDIAVDFVRIRWSDPHASRFGRRGQRQHGVDILGSPRRLSPKQAGAQCKNTERLTLADVIAEVDKAKTFKGDLGEYLIVTSAERDAQLQMEVRSYFREHPTAFPVELVFWADITADIAGHGPLVQKYWKGFEARGSQTSGEGDGLTHEDLLVLSALADRRSEDADDPDAEQYAMSGIEISVRTTLSYSSVRIAVDVLNESGVVDIRPWGAGEGAGAPFKFSRAWIMARGERLLRAQPPLDLRGFRLRPFEYVAMSFPDNSDLPWDLQTKGQRIEWTSEYELPGAFAAGATPVETAFGGRAVQLRSRAQPCDLLLLKRSLDEPSEEETLRRIKERTPAFVYLKQEAGEWIARSPTPMPNPLGGPPAAVSQKVLAQGATRLALLAALRIRAY